MKMMSMKTESFLPQLAFCFKVSEIKTQRNVSFYSSFLPFCIFIFVSLKTIECSSLCVKRTNFNSIVFINHVSYNNNYGMIVVHIVRSLVLSLRFGSITNNGSIRIEPQEKAKRINHIWHESQAYPIYFYITFYFILRDKNRVYGFGIEFSSLCPFNVNKLSWREERKIVLTLDSVIDRSGPYAFMNFPVANYKVL